MSVLNLAFKLILYTILIAVAIIFIPGLPPNLEFKPFSSPCPKKLEGKLAPNDILDKAELLIDGEFVGPETVAIRDGNQVFAGIEGGYIIQIYDDGKWRKICRLGGQQSDGFWESPYGRPMGLRFNNQGKLFVTDAYYGIYEVDVDRGTAKQVLSNKTPLSDGQAVSYANDLDIDQEGVIYFTDTSILSRFHNIYIEGLGDPSGRLIKFDPKSKKTEILLQGIHYANGVQFSKSGDFLVIVESIRSRLWKYYVKGPKKGTKELLIDALPGVPDNVRSNGKGGFYISLVIVDTDEAPSAFRLVGPYPAIRKLILRTQHLIIKILQLIDRLVPSEFLKSLQLSTSHLGPFGNILNLPRKVIIVEVDENGDILKSLQNKDGKICFISDMYVGDTYAYFGSPYDNRFFRLKKEFL